MTVVTVVKRPATYKAVQFTGMNEDEIATVVRPDQFTPATEEVPAMIHLPYVGAAGAQASALFPGVWVVASSSEVKLLTGTQYAAQFQPAAS